MKEMDNPFFVSSDWIEADEDFIDKENFIQALLAEDAAMEERFPFAEEEIQEATPEVTERTLLKETFAKLRLPVWKTLQEQRMILEKL